MYLFSYNIVFGTVMRTVNVVKICITAYITEAFTAVTTPFLG